MPQLVRRSKIDLDNERRRNTTRSAGHRCGWFKAFSILTSLNVMAIAGAITFCALILRR